MKAVVKTQFAEMRLLGIAMLVLCMAALPVLATEYHVDGIAGDDASDGKSSVSAFRTFAKAASRLQPGDSLNLVPGQVYRETLYLRRSGTPAKPIVIRGNGAVIDGLKRFADDSWQDRGGGLYLSPNKRRWGAHDPQVTDRGGNVISIDPATHARRVVKGLGPGEAAWDKEGAWYRSDDGKPPRGLSGYMLGEGVNIAGGASYITVENLTCQHVSNDGFNVHGSSFGLVFRNVVGRYCGDEGLSVHEDVQATVFNGYFHHCGDGICDICASQTQYFGCTVTSNRLYGVGFHGGIHSLYGCTIFDNFGEQFYVKGGELKSFGFVGDSPVLKGVAYLKDTRIVGGEGSAVKVCGGSAAHIDRCELFGTEIGANVQNGGTLHVTRTKWGEFSADRTKVEDGGKLVE